MKQLRNDRHRLPLRPQQSGIALMAMLTLLTLLGLYVFVGQLSTTQFLTARALETTDALAQGRDALIADAIAQPSISDAGYLRLPDLGVDGFGVAAEGGASANFAGNGQDRSVIGKLPWKTLTSGPLRSQGECLWYVVAGRFQNGVKTAVFNWDTQGQIDVIDGNGAVVASNLAALVVAPGRSLGGQARDLADAAYRQCGGNYDARNYLDTFDNANALSGEVNYFAGSTNNRVASGNNNKRFVMAETDFYNDRLVFITAADIFDPLIRRSDFSGEITSLLDNAVFQAHLQAIAVTGSKGTDNLLCNQAPNPPFCTNWKEMLFLTQLPAPAPISIDGAPSGNCSRVLIFAGRRGAGQSRNDGVERANKNNYLENPNLASFNVPTAAAANFSGVSVFDYRTPATDVVRCLP